MNTTKFLNPITPEDSVSLNYIVYEKSDDGLLVDCEITRNEKRFHSTVCIDFHELNRLIGVISAQHEIDIYDLISEHIISSDNAICEVNLEKAIGHAIVLRDFQFNTLELRKAA